MHSPLHYWISFTSYSNSAPQTQANTDLLIRCARNPQLNPLELHLQWGFALIADIIGLQNAVDFLTVTQRPSMVVQSLALILGTQCLLPGLLRHLHHLIQFP